MLAVTEAGMYDVVINSNKDIAKPFKRWVTQRHKETFPEYVAWWKKYEEVKNDIEAMMAHMDAQAGYDEEENKVLRDFLRGQDERIARYAPLVCDAISRGFIHVTESGMHWASRMRAEKRKLAKQKTAA